AIAATVKTLSPRGLRSFAELAESFATLAPQTRDDLVELERSLGVAPASLQLSAELPAESKFTSAPTFDAKKLQSVLDGRFAVARNNAREFLAEPKHRALYGVDKSEHRAQVFEWLQELAKNGFGGLAYPGVVSDAKEGLGPFLVTFETLGFGDLSLAVKFGVQFGLWGGSVFFLGNDAQKKQYLPKVASLEYPGCFAMSEVGHGSNVADLETTVTWSAEKKCFVLHTPGESARKDWAGNAAQHAKFATVFAQLQVGEEKHGVHAFVVRIRDDAGEPVNGVRIGDCGQKLGLNGVDNGRIWFDHVEISRDALLGRYAEVDENGIYKSPIESPSKRFFTMLGTLIGGRISVGAGAVSAARAALAIAVRYAEVRRQFGTDVERRLLDYPTHRARLLPHVADTVLLRVAFRQLRARHAKAFTGELGDTRELEAQAAALKVLGSRHAIAAVQAAREACGGQGYLAVNRIPELRTDVDIFTTFEGDNTVLSQLVGKAMLGTYRKQLATGGTRAVVRAVARRVGSALGVRRAGGEPVSDRAWQVAALAFREEHVVETCAARIKKRLDDGMEGEAAVLAVQEHVVAIAEAFGERCIAQWFVEEEARFTPDGRDAKQLATMLGDLALLARIDAHAAWFLETGYYDAAKSREIKREITRLVEQLAPHARTIVDAFRIPDACLAAPIAFFDPAHPSYP
ncbi:MAG TPA: acyl-CoA dehydrogenase, partial [Kofleriaceae bacterium]